MFSSSESEMLEKSIDFDDSEINFIPEVEIENARQRAALKSNNYLSSEDNLFNDEPLADEEWITSGKWRPMKSLKESLKINLMAL